MRGLFIPTMLLGLLLCHASAFAAMTAGQYVHLGNVAGRQEKYKDAVADYTKAIEADPSLANAYYNRGYVYIEMRKYKQAMADLDHATELDPKYAAAYHLKGIAYFYRKKYPKAVEEYNKAILIEPDNVRFHISRMSAYFKMGNNDKVWKDIIKIQQLGGTVNPAIINLVKNRNYRE